MKIITGKNYGSIPHLSNSRLGPGDHHCEPGQERICTLKARDKHDIIIVQEKLDGSNVGVVKINGKIHAITRSGYTALSSPYDQHRVFHDWVEQNKFRFDWLEENERVVGEWLYQAHGTKYELLHEPFVAFDIMTGSKRQSSLVSLPKLKGLGFITPNTIHIGPPITTEKAIEYLGNGKSGAIGKPEGLIYRVERLGNVDFLCKYVRPDYVNGAFLPEITGCEPVINYIV